MKKILILGAGNAQVDLIEYCKEKGYDVFGCSYSNTDKGIPLLDHFEQINIVDVESIKEYMIKNDINLVYSVGSDIAMPTVSKVAEELNIPCLVSSETAKLCNTKDDMRKFLGPNFKGNVPYVVIDSKEDLNKVDFFPAIMKPVDSQGQRGVCEVNNLDELFDNYERSVSYSRSGRLIVEQYLQGDEISVNAFFENGKLKFGLVSDRISFSEFPGGIIKKHKLPTKFSQGVSDKALDLVKRVANVISIHNGPAYFQIKVVNEEPYLIEVTPRLDGCHMWKLINYYCGVNLLDATIKLLVGEKVPEFTFEPKEGEFYLEFICQEPGTHMKKYEIEDVIYSRTYYNENDVVRKLNGYMEKCGFKIYMKK